ncbi:MAG TPA: hypothetical protein VMS92_10605 [Mycobacterium sp.]|nr:hypothetical protein [Mycobacterium sp.]
MSATWQVLLRDARRPFPVEPLHQQRAAPIGVMEKEVVAKGNSHAAAIAVEKHSFSTSNGYCPVLSLRIADPERLRVGADISAALTPARPAGSASTEPVNLSNTS